MKAGPIQAVVFIRVPGLTAEPALHNKLAPRVKIDALQFETRTPRMEAWLEHLYSWFTPARAQSSSCCEVPPPTPQAPSITPSRIIGTAPWPMIM
jgi:hypothetical protein